MQWIAIIELIEALKPPRFVVARHKRPDARDDELPALMTLVGD
jgi:hypothetical protein